jgi:menaquinone-specific isochorismate synthase
VQSTACERDELEMASAQAWPVTLDHRLPLDALREAAARAARSGHPIVASVTMPVPWLDTLRFFDAAHAAGFADTFYWERPVRRLALAAAGRAAVIVTTGRDHITAAATERRALLNGAVRVTAAGTPAGSLAGPMLAGGFAFDPRARGALWDGFPDGLLVLPRLALATDGDRAWLTINALVAASDDPGNRADTLLVALARLRAAVERAVPPELAASRPLTTRDLRPAADWMALVAATTARIRAGACEKVVLARGVEADADAPFDPTAALHCLRAAYPDTYIFAFRRGGRCFLGATPEQLARVEDGRAHTMALAGSAPRGASPEEDEALGDALLHSAKNGGEHAIVVAQVRDALRPHTTRVNVAPAPRLLKLRNVQHLRTPIAAELAPGRCILDVIAALHPTPAVGGHPRAAALAAIRASEELDRGWYAGPIGWVGADGGGEFAVALRSALVDDSRATLFAGCGIVADSDPRAEYDESCLKLQPMLRALAGED